MAQPTKGGEQTLAELLLYALGEFRRIEAYGAPEKRFLCMPEEAGVPKLAFPKAFVAPLVELEETLKAAIVAAVDEGGPTATACSLGLVGYINL